MVRKNVLPLLFVLVVALLAARFAVNLRQRSARAFPDKFSGASFTGHLALIWEVLRWSGPYLAPEGTYHVIRYLSVPTPSGPVGLVPGQEVRAVRETGARVIVTAADVTGSRELDVPRSALTDDLDLARNLASRDRSAHDEFRTRLEAEEIARERVRLGLYKEAAANVAAAERNRVNDPDGGIGGRRSALDAGPRDSSQHRWRARGELILAHLLSPWNEWLRPDQPCRDDQLRPYNRSPLTVKERRERAFTPFLPGWG